MQETVLNFYTPRKPLKYCQMLHRQRVAAVILQKYNDDWQPLAYSSKFMTEAKTRYAQIERELIGILLACERFQQHI